MTAGEILELLTRAQAQEEQAKERLCRAFLLLVYKETGQELFYRVLKEDGPSIAWEAFLKLVQEYDVEDERIESFPGLAKTVIHRALLNAVWKENRHSQDLSLEKSLKDELVTYEVTDASDAMGEVEADENFKQMLAQLTEKQHEVVWLRFKYDLSFKQIGEILGMSGNGVYRIYTRAMKQLKKKIA